MQRQAASSASASTAPIDQGTRRSFAHSAPTTRGKKQQEEKDKANCAMHRQVPPQEALYCSLLRALLLVYIEHNIMVVDVDYACTSMQPVAASAAARAATATAAYAPVAAR